MLPGFSPRTFRAYAHWVYTDKVLPEAFWQTSSTEISASNEQIAYVDLYLLAEFLDDTRIRVEIVEAMISKMTSWDSVPGWSVWDTVWEQTPKGSPLRSVILESKIRCQSHSNFAGHVEDYEKEFLEELATLLMQRSDSNNEVETLEQLSARMRAQLLSLPVRDHPDIAG